MITLLRIQGIPARKVTGYLISDSSDFRPSIGYTRTFTYPDFLGHAWVEYYIPNIGWISCEPQVSSLYKTSSYRSLTQNNGAWFDFPPTPTSISEFTWLLTTNAADYELDYTLTITVTGINLNPEINWLEIIVPIAIIIGVVVLVGLVIYVIVKKTR
jgi:transglutaminase-like putative cysteine protease